MGYRRKAPTHPVSTRTPFTLIAEEEDEALASLRADRGVPANNIHRAQQWGWRFHSCGRPLASSDRLSPVPAWAMRLVRRLLAADASREFMPTQEAWGTGVQNALLNEYEPGEGLARHTDDLRFWTSWVLGLSLNSGVTMTFSRPVTTCLSTSLRESVDVWLPRRSCYVLSDDARYLWTHEIAASPVDVVDGVAVPRRHRTSLTLRSIAPCWMPDEQAAASCEPATPAAAPRRAG